MELTREYAHIADLADMGIGHRFKHECRQEIRQAPA